MVLKSDDIIYLLWNNNDIGVVGPRGIFLVKIASHPFPSRKIPFLNGSTMPGGISMQTIQSNERLLIDNPRFYIITLVMIGLFLILMRIFA
jgi:hypothetical protein